MQQSRSGQAAEALLPLVSSTQSEQKRYWAGRMSQPGAAHVCEWRHRSVQQVVDKGEGLHVL